MVSSLDGSSHKFLKKLLVCRQNFLWVLAQSGKQHQQQKKRDDWDRVSHRHNLSRTRL
jgi:hypothetical protein